MQNWNPIQINDDVTVQLLEPLLKDISGGVAVDSHSTNSS